MRKSLIALSFFVFQLQLLVQTASGQFPSKFLSPGEFKRISAESSSDGIFYLRVSSPDSLALFASANHQQVQLLAYYQESRIYKIRASGQFLLSAVSPLGYVTSIAVAQNQPKEESPVSYFNDAVNEINAIHSMFPDLQGNKLVASIKENSFDTTDIDLLGRTIPTADKSNMVTAHATDMATLIAGAGNSFYSGLGCAKYATIIASDFANLMPDNTDYQNYGVTVQNHSYGTVIENFYGMEAYAYDQSAISHPKVLNVFSAGNSGDQTPADGNYKGLAGFANLTGNFKMAKNILTVGSIDEFSSLLRLSSRGPAYDGRLKPELVAYGTAGSSQASALVSGIVLLLQNAYMKMHADSLADNMLIKAILINSADDAGPKGIDFYTGYGNVNALKAIEAIRESRFFTGVINTGEEKQFPVTIPANVNDSKVTLVWADPPAQPGAFKALENDLDLTLINVQTGEEWKPWVLHTEPSVDSLNLLPVRNRDSLNTVEQVTLDMPPAGQYQVKVRANSLATSSQTFSIAWQSDTLNTFTWHFPCRNDNLLSGSINTLRWDNQYKADNGVLEYSIDKGNTWKTINQHITPGEQLYEWTAPDTNVTAVARMTIDNKSYYTDTFSISSPPAKLGVGFDCIDSALLFWPKMNGINAYTVYAIRDNYLQPVESVADTFSVVHQVNQKAPFFAVAPVLDANTNGMKSYAINDKTQGVQCYVRGFLADLQPGDSTVKTTLSLGTVFNVKNIAFEKALHPDTWQALQVQQAGAGFTYTYTDTNQASRDGVVFYRGKIGLQSGGIIYTDALPVYVIRKSDFVIFPTLLHRSESFQVISKNSTSGSYTATIYDISGRARYFGRLFNRVETVDPGNLEPGVYLFIIRSHNNQVFQSKIICL